MKETVKTIARGMPDASGVTVVTNSRVLFSTREAAGAHVAPGIPCALYYQRVTKFVRNSGVSRRGNVEVYLE